ncbi:MAG: glycosyltransferase family 2 protein [Anaerolineae bacterium]|nr:glycosyltransferase family 2 protein [Anaerolineae bacterium]
MSIEHPVISIIVIGRNEGSRLAACLESTITAAQRLNQSYELLYVDSASQDNSTAIASKYPATVLHLKPGQPLSAAAGRSLGTHYARGDYLAFFDGDIVCDPDWFVKALPFFDDDTVGIVSGNIIDVFQKHNGDFSRLARRVFDDVVESRTIGGVSIVRRTAIQAAGSFDPFVRGREEQEFAFRVMAQGFRILGLPFPMCDHHTSDLTITEIVRRRRNGYYIGLGQVLRATWHTPDRWRYLWSLKVPLVVLLWLLSLVFFTVVSIGFQFYGLLLLNLISTLLIISLLAVRLHSLRRGLLYVMVEIFTLEGIVKGLLEKKPVDSGRLDYDVLQQGKIL